jgi:hypothetical protein
MLGFDPRRHAILPGLAPSRGAWQHALKSHPHERALDPSQVYNARAFRHPLKRQIASGRAPRIWHWHGYKPQDVHCWLTAMGDGSWPARAWGDVRTPCNHPSCRWKPIFGSGCRFLGRIEPKPCYLRTYAWLLSQHQKMLRLATNITHLHPHQRW